MPKAHQASKLQHSAANEANVFSPLSPNPDLFFFLQPHLYTPSFRANRTVDSEAHEPPSGAITIDALDDIQNDDVDSGHALFNPLDTLLRSMEIFRYKGLGSSKS